MASVLSELGYTHFATLARSLGSELATVSNDLPLVRGGRLQDINIFRESSAHPRSLSLIPRRERRRLKKQIKPVHPRLFLLRYLSIFARLRNRQLGRPHYILTKC